MLDESEGVEEDGVENIPEVTEADEDEDSKSDLFSENEEDVENPERDKEE